MIPTPMKLRAASVKIAWGMPKVTATIIGVRALGSRCRKIIRPPEAPIVRAALTKSFSRKERIWARTSRLRVTQPTRPMAIKILKSPLPSMVIIRMTKSNVGNAYIMSTSRIITVSTLPP